MMELNEWMNRTRREMKFVSVVMLVFIAKVFVVVVIWIKRYEWFDLIWFEIEWFIDEIEWMEWNWQHKSICIRCHSLQPIYGRNMCQPCYSRWIQVSIELIWKEIEEEKVWTRNEWFRVSLSLWISSSLWPQLTLCQLLSKIHEGLIWFELILIWMRTEKDHQRKNLSLWFSFCSISWNVWILLL